MSDEDAGVPDTTTCQHPGHHERNRPWADHSRPETCKRASHRIAETEGYGLKFTKLVKELHSWDAIENATYDYKYLRKFVDDLERNGFVRVERIGRQERESDRPLLIYPTDALVESVFNTASKHERSTVGSSDCSERESSIAAMNAAQFLGHRWTIETAADWGYLIGAFGAKRLYAERGAARGTITHTKYDSKSRAMEGVDRIEQWFENAIMAGHRHGAIVTATTQPTRFESVNDAVCDLRADVKGLMRKIGRETGDDTGMPPRVTVVEPTERGVPHVHIAVFVDPAELPSEHDLHNYWQENVGRGFEVDRLPIAVSEDATDTSGSETWTWMDNAPDESDGRLPVTYLSEGALAIASAARLSVDDVEAVRDAYRALGDEPVKSRRGFDLDALDVDATMQPEAVRKAAWYWAIDLEQQATASRSLRGT